MKFEFGVLDIYPPLIENLKVNTAPSKVIELALGELCEDIYENQSIFDTNTFSPEIHSLVAGH